ncbi:glycine zipper domain-containing protein [Henriciella marina]|uniref:glycine zipper domain-containing protein n=1 Tax=Henriciella marina TaxID=453851 RepID=UPI0003605A66|nr:glycine zipper domain-containing protein [Henriciella marina]
MKTLLKTTAIAATGLLMAACTQSGYTERNAAVGAGLGAAAGAVIGNNTGDGNATRGAIIGAGVGGLAGAAKGCTEAEDCDTPGVRDQADEKDYDGDGYSDAVDRYPRDPRAW